MNTLSGRAVARWLLSLLLIMSAQAIDADPGDFTSGHERYHMSSGERAGQWRLLDASQKERVFKVPLRWSVEGEWRAERAKLSNKITATVITLRPPHDVERALVLVGSGNLLKDQLLWLGVREARQAPAQVTLEDLDSDGEAELVRRERALHQSPCAAKLEALKVERYDPKAARFVPVTPTWPAAKDTLNATAWLEAGVDLDAKMLGLWTRSIHRRIHVSPPDGARMGWRVDRDSAALGDASEGTTWPPKNEGGHFIMLEPHASAPAEALLVRPTRDAVASSLTLYYDDHVVAATLPPDASARGALIPLEGAPTCVLVQLGADTVLSELSPLGAFDRERLDETALLERFFTTEEDATRRLLGRVIAKDKERFEEAVQKYVAAQTKPEVFSLILEAALAAQPPISLYIASGIALNPAAPHAIVIEALSMLDRYPKEATAALRRRLEALEVDSAAALEAAALLASYPGDKNLGPLLSSLDRSEADSPQQEALLVRLSDLGPRVVPTLLTYVVAQTMRDRTRVALLRVLLRTAPTWLQEHPDEALAERVALVGLLRAPKVGIRLLAIRLLAVFQVAEAAGPLAGQTREGKVDVERAEALRALASFGFEPIDQAILGALSDRSPTVRIAAAEVLARPKIAAQKAVGEALATFMGTERWPEAQAPALLGLLRSGHPGAQALAFAALESQRAPRIMREAAALGLSEASEALPWERLRPLFEDPRLSMSARSVLLDAFAERSAEGMTKLQELADESLSARKKTKPLGEMLISTLAALQRLKDAGIATRLVDVFNATEDGEVRAAVLQMMAHHDTPEVRAALRDATKLADPELSETAQESLDRLDRRP